MTVKTGLVLLSLMILVVILSGCGQDNLTSPEAAEIPIPTSSSPDIETYYQRFISYGIQLKNTNLTSNIPMNFNLLGFTPRSGGIIGVCITYSDGSREIQIDSSFWAIASDTQKEELVFHELGHCSLLRNHLLTLNSSGLPESVMYPYILDPMVYAGSRAQYLNELFNDSHLFNPSVPTLSGSQGLQTVMFDPDYGIYCDQK